MGTHESSEPDGAAAERGTGDGATHPDPQLEEPPSAQPSDTQPPSSEATDTPATDAKDDPTVASGGGRRGPEAIFAEPRRQKPQRYNRASSRHHPTTPLDPIHPYVAGPVPRRRRSDVPVLIFALIVAALVMSVVCIAGFALFRTYGIG